MRSPREARASRRMAKNNTVAPGHPSRRSAFGRAPQYDVGKHWRALGSADRNPQYYDFRTANATLAMQNDYLEASQAMANTFVQTAVCIAALIGVFASSGHA